MDFLARDDMPLDKDLWERIDKTVVEVASKHLTGRRFIPLFGPTGPGSDIAIIDGITRDEVFKDGIVTTENRQVLQIPQLYADFWLYWRDVEASKRQGFDIDLSALTYAAKQLARKEDELVFYGNNELNIPGLLSVKGTSSQKKSDWTQGENAFNDIASAVTTLENKGYVGSHTLIVSPDLYLELERIQPGTGLLEVDRIKKTLSGKLLKSTVLKKQTALLVCGESPYVDLQVGIDMSSAYIEQVDLNHHFRVLETAVVRIKTPDAIVVFK